MKTKFWLILATIGIVACFAVACGDSTSTGVGAEGEETNGAGDTGNNNNFGGGGVAGDPCLSDEDCSEGLICAGGLCGDKQCETDADCGDATKECKGYQCVTKQVGTPCTTNDECTGTKERCISNYCSSVECITNADCGTGRSCDTTSWACKDGGAGQVGSPCSTDAECDSSVAACDSGSCHKKCAADTDCASGETCVQSAFGVMICKTGSSGCTVDSQCSSGQKCVSGQCVEDTGCATDADCAVTPSTPKCNTSTGACVQCLVSQDCGGGLVCKNNACVSDSGGGGGGTTTGCASDEECCEISGGSVCLASGCSQTGSTAEQCDSSNSCPTGKVPVQAQDQSGNTVCICLVQCTSGGGGGGGGSGQACQTSSDCTNSSYPVCDSFGTGQCVQCLGDLDCPSGQRCDATAKTCSSSGGGGGGSSGCASDEECCSISGGSVCLASGCQNTGSTAEQCDASNACPSGKTPVQAQDQSGNTVCICLVQCSGGGGGGGTGSGAMCDACTSDADCGVDATTGMQMVCTTGLTGQMCGTGDMMTDLMMCMMGGGGGFP